MNVCQCPLAAALPTIPAAGCASDFGQIQKIIFQRIYSSGTTKNKFSAQGKITVLASWTPLKTATDGTKVVVSPYVEAPTADGGDAITFGGGNETLGGIEKVIGRNPVTMTFALRQYKQSIIKALKQMQCETELGVYFVNERGQILALAGATADDYFPIPIRSLFVGDLKLNGFDTPDENMMSFGLVPDWSDDAEIVTPTDFNALIDL